MTAGFEADLAGMASAADLLDQVAEQTAAIEGKLAEIAAADLGPAGIERAVADLTAHWSGHVRAARAEVTAAATGVRDAHRQYTASEDQASAALRRLGHD